MRVRKLLPVLIAAEAAVLLISLLWMANERRAVTAPAYAPNLKLSLQADCVDVSTGASSVQTVPFKPGALTGENRSYFIQTPDINFDGYPDLTLIYRQDPQNTFYDGWVWNNAERRFSHDPTIQTLPSPVFDAQARRVYTCDSESATDHTRGTYAYENGALVEIGRVEQSYYSETGLFAIRTYARRQGRLMLTGEEKLTPAQMEARGQP